ncbi:hypothetical protein F5Y05DRAFT_416578 [Hypoxylon sp. FL0543]|nr:hypothetical protein F5Y05DRAFT_416578 [Hypoxylon sp. FL0543]
MVVREKVWFAYLTMTMSRDVAKLGETVAGRATAWLCIAAIIAGILSNGTPWSARSSTSMVARGTLGSTPVAGAARVTCTGRAPT